MFSGVGGSTAAGVGTWDFHHVRAPEQPIQTHIETIRDLADAIEVEGAQHSYGLNIKSAPAANPDAPVNSFRLSCRKSGRLQ